MALILKWTYFSFIQTVHFLIHKQPFFSRTYFTQGFVASRVGKIKKITDLALNYK